MSENVLSPDRRDLLRTGAAAFPAILATAQSAKALKVGLVGCGGRGTGAAAQALKADDYAELVAMGDIFQERIDASVAALKRVVDPKVKVETGNMFTGLDAFEKVINSGVDVVLLATPPGFRPMHLRAAIEAGKHVFCEKPVAVDAPGVRSVLETSRWPRRRTCRWWRDSAGGTQLHSGDVRQVHNGAIGDLLAYYATYYTSPVKPMPPADTRPAGMSDVEWQIRNWYNFCWTCGDGLVEQAVHSVDKWHGPWTISLP